MNSTAYCSACREMHPIIACKFSCPKADRRSPLDKVSRAVLVVSSSGTMLLDINPPISTTGYRWPRP